MATKEIPVYGGRSFTGWVSVASAKTQHDAKAVKKALLEQGALDVDIYPSYYVRGL